MTFKSNRVPLQVSPKFAQKLKDLQVMIRMQTGENKSLRDLTEEIISSTQFKEIEKNIIKAGNIKVDVKLRFDRRFQ